MENGLKDSMSLSLRQLTIAGMLIGITIFMGLTRLGFIPLPTGVNLTIMHIPVIIGAILEGPLVGSIIGFAFGLFSMYQAFTAPGIFSFWFWNPVVAILPRVLIALAAYYIYKVLKVRFKKAAIGAAAIAGTLINTIGVLSLAYLFYGQRISELLNSLDINSSAGYYLAVTIGMINGIPEALVSALISAPVILTILKIKKRM
ncbi:ECF transporter S component [Alloiococcus sp. CFN-8]|uniref:ECF transporter S component n=1 Tax=Alloiococcus sp. CFN-8 TaxID=3416081 RepID=UPI003CF52850